MDKQLNNIDINYDPTSDVMYCSFGGPPSEAYSVETSEGVFIRLHPETNQPVGITIIDFSRRFTLHPGQKVSISLNSPLNELVA